MVAVARFDRRFIPIGTRAERPRPAGPSARRPSYTAGHALV